MHLMYVRNCLYIAYLAGILPFAISAFQREMAVLWYIVSSKDNNLTLKTQCNWCFSLRN